MRSASRGRGAANSAEAGLPAIEVALTAIRTAPLGTQTEFYEAVMTKYAEDYGTSVLEPN